MDLQTVELTDGWRQSDLQTGGLADGQTYRRADLLMDGLTDSRLTDGGTYRRAD
jgi:hypothetical protein